MGRSERFSKIRNTAACVCLPIPGIWKNARRIVERIAVGIEQDIEERVSRRMQEKHDEYIQDIRREVLMEDGDPETEETRKKLTRLLKLEERSIARSALYFLRPRRLSDIVGQDRAIRALLSKLATPYPQHVILYGPPGVGKTSAARLVLEEARKLSFSPFAKDAPFVETDGATMRWDPREITNPLLGSVHDPIYQGAKRDLAEIGVPEPKLGLVTEATGGILFIDEIGEMDPLLQNKLLKVLEDKRVLLILHITTRQTSACRRTSGGCSRREPPPISSWWAPLPEIPRR